MSVLYPDPRDWAGGTVLSRTLGLSHACPKAQLSDKVKHRVVLGLRHVSSLVYVQPNCLKPRVPKTQVPLSSLRFLELGLFPA